MTDALAQQILRKIILQAILDGDFRLDDGWLHLEADWVELTEAEAAFVKKATPITFVVDRGGDAVA